jgi:hypothetical protein
MRLLGAPATLPVVARRTGGHHVGPHMETPLVPRQDMIYSEAGVTPATILTGEVVSTKYLSAGQSKVGPGTVHLYLQPDDRGARYFQGHRMDIAPSVRHHVGLAPKD